MNRVGFLRAHLSYRNWKAGGIGKSRHPLLLVTASQNGCAPQTMRFRGQIAQIGNRAVFGERAAPVGVGAVTIETNVLFEKCRAQLDGFLTEGLFGRLG